LLSDTWYTLFEAILGFVIGTIFGSLLGLALWYSASWRGWSSRSSSPSTACRRSRWRRSWCCGSAPGWCPRSRLSVSLTAIVALIAAYQAAKDADVDLQSLLISMGADKHQVFFKAVVPSTLPSIIATFRINIGFGLVGAVVGEFISSQRGLGHLIYTASSLYDLNTVWVGLFTLMIMGFVLYYVIDIIERTSLPWKQSNTTTHQVQVDSIPVGKHTETSDVVAHAYRPRRLRRYSPARRCCCGAPALAENKKVTLSQAFQSMLYLPLYVAIDEGFFTQQGLDLTKETAGAPTVALSAVISGSAQFSIHGPGMDGDRGIQGRAGRHHRQCRQRRRGVDRDHAGFQVQQHQGHQGPEGRHRPDADHQHLAVHQAAEGKRHGRQDRRRHDPGRDRLRARTVRRQAGRMSP
jgi:NitT/TauT family transport system permease protein